VLFLFLIEIDGTKIRAISGLSRPPENFNILLENGPNRILFQLLREVRNRFSVALGSF
jgi:hypothetical protein